MLAIPWYFINIFEQHSTFGLLYALGTALSIFWVLYTGTLIDRFDRKNIMVGINAIGGLLMAGIAVTGFLNGGLSLPLVAIAFISTFFIYNVHFPNLYAFAQQITLQKHYSRILSYLEIQHQLTSAIAGAIGAVLLGGIAWDKVAFGGFEIVLNIHLPAWQLHEILLMDAGTYFISLALVALIKYESVAVRDIEVSSIRKRFLTGLRFLKSRPALLLFGCLSYSLFITVLVINFFLMPTYVNNHLEADISSYAIFEVFFAGGALFSGLTIRYIFRNIKPAMGVVILGVLGAMYYYIGIFNTHLGAYYFLTLLLGISNSGTRIMRATYLFNHVPNTVIGRAGSVFHIYQILFRLTFILLFTMAFFSKGDNIIYAFVIFGLFITTSILLLAFNYRKIIHA